MTANAVLPASQSDHQISRSISSGVPDAYPKCTGSTARWESSYAGAAGIAPCIAKTGIGKKTSVSGFFGDIRKQTVSRNILARQFETVRLIAESRVNLVHSPQRIGVLSLSGMGGSGKVARGYAQAMAKAGHHVQFYCNSNNFFPTQDTPDVTVANVNVPSEPLAPDGSWETHLAQELCDRICADPIDVLHVHYLAGLLEAALITKERLAVLGKKIKIAATLHGSEVSNFGKNTAYSKKMADMIEGCDAVSAVSHWLADESQKVFGLKKRPKVIWNSINVDHFNPGRWDGLRESLTPLGMPLLCHVSNFRPVKRTLDTIEIQAALAALGISARLLLIGDGPDIDKTMNRARQLGTHNNVKAIGPLAPQALARYVAASDLALVTSESESFSLAALEAMATGIPVVGTRCGGLNEVVDGIDWKTETDSRLLAGVGDVQSMAEICALLLNDRRLYWSVQLQGVFAPLTRFHRYQQTEGYLRLVSELNP